MSRHPDEPNLQHEADHARAERPHSATRYLILLVVTAFVLLLMSYMMQRRTNQAALESLDTFQKTSNSAVQTIENMIEERDELRAKVDSLEEQIATLNAQLDAASRAMESSIRDAREAGQDTQALNRLNLLRSLYNAKRYQAARELMAKWEEEAPGDMEKRLSTASLALTPEERDVYDPLDAYHKLVKWLG